MKILRLFLVILLPTIAAAGLRASFELSLFQTGCDSAAAVRVETSYLIDRSDLSFVQTDSGRFGVYRAWMEVFQSDSLVFSSGWERFDHLGIGEDVTYTQKIPDLEATCLGAGEYRVRATVQDQNSGKSTQAEWVVTIPSLVTDTPCVSDPVMMARPPEAVSGNPFFERFGLLVVPYADAIFGEELPVLHYYLEIFNPESDTLLVEVNVLGPDRERLFAGDTLVIEPGTTPLPEVGSIGVDRLPSGSYYLQFTPIAAANVQWLSGHSGRRKFFIYNPTVTEMPSDYLEARSRSAWSEVDSLDLLEVFQQLRPLLSAPEQKRFKRLNSDGRRLMLSEFWQQRDPTPGTALNEAQERYLVRLDYVTLQYRTSLQEGWETDQGRIYLKYGAPDSIEQHDFSETADFTRNPDVTSGPDNFETSNNLSRTVSGAYEIWFYDTLEGGVYFVLVDRQGLGDFILVHSTKSGEIQNYNWQQQL